ncbi:MAG: hypothetical protein AAGA20_16390 [Planctomycetota bacterium]
MTLQETLDGIAAASKDKLPAEAQRIMHGHTEFLESSGQASRAIGVGDRAPSFQLDGPDGPVALDDLRTRGPVVITWFRGTW